MAGEPDCEELQQRVQQLEAIVASQLDQENTLEKLFNLSLDMLCVADTKGYFLRVNRAFETILGYSTQRLLDTPYLEFVHPDDKAATLKAAQQLLAGEALICFENRYRCKDGAYKWFEWTCAPVTDEGLLFATARDITAQNALQQELATQRDLFNNVLNNVPASIFWKDRNSVYLGVNNRFTRDTGLPVENIIAKTDYDLAWTREQADFYRQCDRQVMDSGKAMLNIEESQRQSDGKEIHLLTSKVPLLDEAGQVTGLLGIYVNISKLKHAEEEMQRHHEEIAHVIRLSTAGEMASGMAHELNQPLTALVSYCGTALSLLKSLPEPQQQLREILECASEQAQRAGRIIRHLRDFVSKNDNAQQSLELDQLIKDLNFLLASELKNSAVQLEYHLLGQGCHIMVNKVQIEQVLINLVRNSVEAIQAANTIDGKVILETRTVKDGSIEVTVSDNGPGIAADMMDTMFNPFQTSKTSGMGMGLSISRSIIEAHGGSLWADNQRRQGALFGFSLPGCH